MELSINTRNMKMTKKLQSYVERKTQKLDRYVPNLASVNVDLTEANAKNANERQVAQITIRDENGTIIRAEERSSDHFAAVDLGIDKIYRQINRYRGKQRRHRREAAAAEIAFIGDPLPIEAEDIDEGAVVREKQFSRQPMSTEEAVDQMELLGHDFFVFFSSESNEVNVLYKRRGGGDYGLLAPEIS